MLVDAHTAYHIVQAAKQTDKPLHTLSQLNRNTYKCKLQDIQELRVYIAEQFFILVGKRADNHQKLL